MRKNLTFKILFKFSLKKLRMADDHSGPHCARQGISTHWLISQLTNPKEGLDQHNVPDFSNPIKISLPESDSPEDEKCPVCL